MRLRAASQRPFYRLSLTRGVEVHQPGTDQGLLRVRVELADVRIALGERADLVVDFMPHRGAQLLLISDAITLMQFRIAVGAGARGIRTPWRRAAFAVLAVSHAAN